MSNEKDYTIILCDGCGKESKIEFEYVSEVKGTKCPKCNSDNIWFKEFVQFDTENLSLTMGRGGRGKSG